MPRREELWSPQMRRWARDADRHGIEIGLYRSRRVLGETTLQGGNPFASNALITEKMVNIVTNSGDTIIVMF